MDQGRMGTDQMKNKEDLPEVVGWNYTKAAEEAPMVGWMLFRQLKGQLHFAGISRQTGKVVFGTSAISGLTGHEKQIITEVLLLANENVMRVQVDNRVVEMVLVPQNEHKSNKIVYHELNEHGVPTTEHSFAKDFFQGDGSFWTNGHHYRTGNMVGVKCEFANCDCCV